MERRLRPSALDAARRAGVRQAQQQVQRLSAPSSSVAVGVLVEVEQPPAFTEIRALVDVGGGAVWVPADPAAYVVGGSVYVEVDSQRRPRKVTGPTGMPVPDADGPTTVEGGALPVVIQPAAMLDQGAREAANDAVTQIGRAFTTDTRPPTVEDSMDRPPNAVWTMVDDEGGQVSRWRWDADTTTWVEEPLSVEIIPEAYIDHLVTNETFTKSLVLSEEVDGYLNRTSARGVEIFGPDGMPLSRYGAFAENALNFYRDGQPVSSISDEGVVSALEGSFDTLSMGGTNLADTLATMPAGIHHRTSTGIAGIAKLVGRGNVALLELDVDIEHGRQYFVYVPQFTVSVGPDGRTNGRAKIDATIRYTWDGARPNSNASVFAGAPGFVHEGENFLNITVGPRSLLRSEIPAQSGRVRLMLMLHSDGPPVSVYEGWGAIPQMLVMDAGTMVPNTGIRWTVDRGIPPGSEDPEPPPPPDPTPPKRRYTTRFNSIEWRTFQNVTGNGTGSRTTAVSGPQQGFTPYYSSAGQYASHYYFNSGSIQAELAGATVLSAKVRVTCTHSHANSGGTARLHAHGHGPSGNWGSPDYVGDAHFSRGQTRWLGVPSPQNWQTGQMRGVGFWSRNSNSTNYYMRFGTTAVLELTYEK